MPVFNEISEIGFDLEKAKSALHAYSRSIGMECSLIDSKGIYLYKSTFSSNLCPYCGKLQTLTKKQFNCSSVHLYGSYQAERFGGKYVYFCPIGLVHWASPITKDGKIQGALIGGPVLMVNPDDFLIDDLIKASGIPQSQIDDLKEYIDRVPVIHPNLVNSFSELLSIVASNLSSETTSKIEDNLSSNELQSSISESIHQFKLMDDREGHKIDYPFGKERELLNLISMGDKAGSQKILNELLGYVFFSTGNDFEIIKARILELLVLLSRAAVEGGADSEEIFGLNYQYLSDIHNIATIEDLTFWLSNIMSRFTDCVFNLSDVRHKDTMYKAIDYIKRNYMKNITLEEAANHVFLNPSYFSKIFKSEMNSTFVSYVNKVRINSSKNLLLDTSIPLTEVANLVGFEDQSYFTKVFKKATGATPGKYRESRGQIS